MRTNRGFFPLNLAPGFRKLARATATVHMTTPPPPASLSLLLSRSLSHSPPVWWQTPERSPLLVIELTSFSKYQKPCWIIKICLYWGTYFWHRTNRTMYRKQSRACWISPGWRKQFVLFLPWVFFSSLLSLSSSLYYYYYSEREKLALRRVTGTLVTANKQPVITVTALLRPWGQVLCRHGTL